MPLFLGLISYQRLDEFIERRRSIARFYDLAVGNIGGLSPQMIIEGTESSYNYYTVRVEPESGLDRDKIVEELKRRNIETGVHYPRALTEQPALGNYVTDACPVAEELAGQVFSIPIHPYLTEREIEYVVSGLREAVYH